ncbi:MAG: CheR family methyltransferase [Deltaproteobacteria bacterium]
MLPPEKLKFFANYIEKELGIIYSESNYFQLENRLAELSGLLNLGGVEQVWEKAQTGIQGYLKQALLDISTNNETSFFRDPKVFTTLEKGVIPQWVQQKKRLIRIWSAASSYGQEPYSMAMLMDEAQKINPTLTWEILATDIAEKVLTKASEGKYTQFEVQRGLCAKRLVKYFQKTPEHFWMIRPEVKAKVKFQKQNLLGAFDKIGKFDLILCRNVLIYQKPEAKSKIVARLSECLNPGGYLIMGAGESLIGISDRFNLVNFGDAIFYQLKPVTEKGARAA